MDPFAGSGSTLAAAQSCKIRSIGIESNLEYYEMGATAIPKLAALKI